MAQLFTWWNLIYVIPFCAGFLFLLLQVIGLGETGLGADHDMDHDFDHDFDHDLDHDIDHDMDHDADHDHDHDAEHDIGESAFWRVLSVLGVGKVPLTIILMTWCFVWGVTGYTLNQLLESVFKTPWLFVLPSLLVSVVVSVAPTSFVARAVAKIMPKTTTHSTKKTDLIGKEGTALYSVDQNSGTIRVMDDYGNLQQYSAFTREKSIPGDSKILIIAWDKTRKAFEVSLFAE